MKEKQHKKKHQQTYRITGQVEPPKTRGIESCRRDNTAGHRYPMISEIKHELPIYHKITECIRSLITLICFQMRSMGQDCLRP